jgi:hypothetical protein
LRQKKYDGLIGDVFILHSNKYYMTI